MAESTADDSGILKQIQEALGKLKEHLHNSMVRQGKLGNWSRFLTVLILIAFVIFGVMFYKTLGRNLSADKFAQSIQSNMTELAPVLTDAAVQVMADVTPVYVDLASKKAESLIPVFTLALDEQVNIFAANMSVFAEAQLQRHLDNIVTKFAAEFRKQFPDLTDEQMQAFVKESEDRLRLLLMETAQHIVDESLPEIMQMKYLSESMGHEGLPKDEEEMYVLFVHNLLMLLDKELMEE